MTPSLMKTTQPNPTAPSNTLATARPATSLPTQSSPCAWWQVGYVWLVLMGPVCVVVAALASAYIAMQSLHQEQTQAPLNLSAEQIRYNHETSHHAPQKPGMLFGPEPSSKERER